MKIAAQQRSQWAKIKLFAAKKYSLLFLHFNTFCILKVRHFEDIFTTFAYFCALTAFLSRTYRITINLPVWVIGRWTDAIWKLIKEGGKNCVLQYWITGPWKYLPNTKEFPSFRVLLGPSLVVGVCMYTYCHQQFFLFLNSSCPQDLCF